MTVELKVQIKKFYKMKTKILTTALALIISGTMVLAHNDPKTDKTKLQVTKTEIQKDSVYYGCNMHPDVKMDKPGKCPVCGMALEKKTMKMATTKEQKSDTLKIYTCTMHPEVNLDKPGKCPKCGMDLVVKK
jgi:hypothetical protein